METYTEDLIETYEHFEEDERILYKDSTYDIVSKVASHIQTYLVALNIA